MTAARKEHSYYEGYHTWTSDPAQGAFNIEWAHAERAPNGQAGWFYTDSRDGYARGPFTSSRAAFRAARLSYDRKTRNMVDAPTTLD